MHKTIDSLKKENHELEIENTHLKDKLEIPHHEEHTDEKRHPFQGIRQALS